jgi:tRNA (guanine37-N1)-methyltransferase
VLPPGRPPDERPRPRFDVPLFVLLTLFPEALEPYLHSSIVGIAQQKGAVSIDLVDFRDFARDRHRTVDDRPFGGGPGMVLRPEPVIDCVEWLEERHGRFKKLMMCPGGTPFCQAAAQELSQEERVLLLCGRYEGFDERIAECLDFERVSVGDYVLCGGELPALSIVEAAVRLLPGVLGDERSAVEESFQESGDLDHPHYTRPREFRGHEVPEVLLSGDHGRIEQWRREQARERTRSARPDLSSGQEPTSSPPRVDSNTTSSPKHHQPPEGATERPDQR